jgi:hypothetical protein
MRNFKQRHWVLVSVIVMFLACSAEDCNDLLNDLVGDDSSTAEPVRTSELVAGGGMYQPPAEILTLGAAPSFSATKGLMRTDRHAQTANLITTGIHNGQVLIAGGNSDSGTSGFAIGIAERYDPASGTFSCVGGVPDQAGPCPESMTTPRIFHTATNLQDGTILFTGGVDENDNVLSSAELYEPTRDSFIATKGGPIWRVL